MSDTLARYTHDVIYKGRLSRAMDSVIFPFYERQMARKLKELTTGILELFTKQEYFVGSDVSPIHNKRLDKLVMLISNCGYNTNSDGPQIGIGGELDYANVRHLHFKSNGETTRIKYINGFPREREIELSPDHSKQVGYDKVNFTYAYGDNGTTIQSATIKAQNDEKEVFTDTWEAVPHSSNFKYRHKDGISEPFEKIFTIDELREITADMNHIFTPEFWSTNQSRFVPQKQVDSYIRPALGVT